MGLMMWCYNMVLCVRVVDRGDLYILGDDCWVCCVECCDIKLSVC